MGTAVAAAGAQAARWQSCEASGSGMGPQAAALGRSSSRRSMLWRPAPAMWLRRRCAAEAQQKRPAAAAPCQRPSSAQQKRLCRPAVPPWQRRGPTTRLL